MRLGVLPASISLFLSHINPAMIAMLITDIHSAEFKKKYETAVSASPTINGITVFCFHP